MKLKERVLKQINNPKERIQLAAALNCTEQSIIKLIWKNRDNGKLTTATAMKVIREVTGLKDKDILEEVSEVSTD